MAGLGTDIIEISRIEKAIEKERFCRRVYTPAEQEWLDSLGDNRTQSAAGLFCAKEAIAKAMGTGFVTGLSFQDIEIGHTELGAPVVLRPSGTFLLSISHCREYATATALRMDSGEAGGKEQLMIESTGEELLLSCLKPRDPEANKNSFGRVTAVCGCRSYCGAPYFAAMGAIRSGCGILTMAIPDSIHPILANKLNEPTFQVMPSDSEGKIGDYTSLDLNRRAAVLAGPGLGRSPVLTDMVEHILRTADCPIILDADGINALKGRPELLETAKYPVVLTPHAGEFARICDVEEGDAREETALRFARKHHCVLLLKGHVTVIAAWDGRVRQNPFGNPGMAKGGSGDVLSGIILSMLGQGVEPFDAACCGAYIHSRAGDRCANEMGEFGMTPTDMLNAIPYILKPLNSREW